MKHLLPLLLLLTAMSSRSQDSLLKYNNHRDQVTIAGMKILAGWGAVNLGAGAAGWAASKEGTGKYFYQMSAFWGAVNTGIALLGLARTTKKQNTLLDTTGTVRAQKIIEKTFLVNGGIDFAYLGTGIYLLGRGNNRDNVKLKGYGSSIIMQGAFLLLFDATMYSLQRTNGNKMRTFLQRTTITSTGKSIGMLRSF